MQSFKVWFTLLALALCVLAAEPPKKLQVETTYMPKDCPLKAAPGDTISVHYTGTLFKEGTLFDSSLKRGKPLTFRLGVGQVIRGWEVGLVGTCVGEKRTLTIPSHMAYSGRGVGTTIPPNAALIFMTEVTSIIPGTHDEL